MSKAEENIWAIIGQYKEKLSLAMTHEQRLEDEYAKVSVLQVEREAGKRVIDSLHREAIMWMHRCHNLPFSGRATRGSRVRLPWEENAWSHHQHLF